MKNAIEIQKMIDSYDIENIANMLASGEIEERLFLEVARDEYMDWDFFYELKQFGYVTRVKLASEIQDAWFTWYYGGDCDMIPAYGLMSNKQREAIIKAFEDECTIEIITDSEAMRMILKDIAEQEQEAFVFFKEEFCDTHFEAEDLLKIMRNEEDLDDRVLAVFFEHDDDEVREAAKKYHQ